MPASFWWNPDTPTAGVFSAATARNWTQPDTNGNWVRATTIPGPSDDLYFDGGVSSENCTIPDQSPVAPAVAFNGLHLKFGWFSASRVGPPTWTAYSGTVTIQDSLAVGTLEMESGAIKQADTVGMNPPVPLIQFAGTLTVNSSLSWTGGTLNSNYVAGKIDLAPGASGVAEPSFTNPGINGTVRLGSTLTMQGDAVNQIGCTMTLFSGTYNLTAGEGFVSENLAEFILKGSPYKVLTIDGTQAGGRAIRVEAGSTALVTAARLQNDEQQASIIVKGTEEDEPMFTNAGTTRITNRVILQIGDENETRKLYYSQHDAGAVTQLEAGSEIATKGKGGVHIEKGKLEIKNLLSNGTPVPSQPEAVISTSQVPLVPTDPTGLKTNLSIGEDAILTMPDGLVNKLRISGDFVWSGTVKLAISRISDACDTISVTQKTWIFAQKGKLDLRWADIGFPFGREEDEEWLLVSTAQGVSREPDKCTPPADPKVTVGFERKAMDKNLLATVDKIKP